MEELNPIRRLNYILKEAVEQGNPKSLAGEVLQKHIAVNTVSDRTQILVEFLELLGNVGQSVRHLKKVTNRDSYLKPIQSLQLLFLDLSFAQNTWENFKSPIVNQNLLHILDMCADTLDKEIQQEFNFRESEVQGFLEKFKSLLQEVDASDLEDNTKNFLKSRLEELCEAICQLSFEDSETLRKTVNATVGKIVIGSIQITQEDREKSIFKDVVEWVGKFGAIVTLSRTTQEWLVPQLMNQVHHIQKLLSSGG
jgi:hypothetical protein